MSVFIGHFRVKKQDAGRAGLTLWPQVESVINVYGCQLIPAQLEIRFASAV